MPFPIAAAIAGGASLVSTGINALTGANANKKNREFAKEQYQVQKNDELEFWRMNNTYNSPQEQMKRMQEAGLNPNLIYGSGGANYTSSAPSAPTKAEYNHRPLNVDSSPLQGYFDVQVKQAQLDNLKTQNSVLLEESLLKSAQRKSLEYGTGFKERTEDYNIETMIHRKNLTAAQSDLKESESRILHNLENITYETAAQKIYNLRLEAAKTSADTDRIREGYKNLIKSGRLQDEELKLRAAGVTSSDAPYFRILGQLLNTFGVDLKNGKNPLKPNN